MIDWCEVQSSDGFFLEQYPGLLEFLASYMDSHAERALTETADTATRRKVQDELDFCRHSYRPTALVGDSRLGKTEALSTSARAWPGRWVLVKCDESNRERGHVESIATPLGLEFHANVMVHTLKGRVEFVLRELRPGLLFDEAHYLIPADQSKGTSPGRLNWVRAKVIDEKIPCVFLSTPQNWTTTLEEYAKSTGYNMAQWSERMGEPVVLDAETSDEDLLKIAACKLPGLSEAELRVAVDLALQKERPTQALDSIAARAAYYKDKRRANRVSMEDVRRAADACGIDVPQPTPDKPQSVRGRGFSSSMQPAGGEAAGPLPRHCREIVPDQERGAMVPA